MLIFPWIFQHHRLPSKVRNWIDGAGIALDVALCAGTSQNATGEETGDDSITIAACKPFGDRDTTKHYFHAIDMLDENALKELLHTRQKSHGKCAGVVVHLTQDFSQAELHTLFHHIDLMALENVAILVCCIARDVFFMWSICILLYWFDIMYMKCNLVGPLSRRASGPTSARSP